MKQHSIYKAVIAGGIGNIVEWYTFLVYVYLTPTMRKLFFPHESVAGSTLLVLLIFAAGFLARPIGAVIFGYVGDQYGRRKALIISQAAMAVTTFLMCLLPTYQTMGLVAPLLLTLLRVIQGLSIAGEYTTSLCYLVEVSSNEERGKWVSTIPASTALGILLSSLAAFSFSQFLSPDALLSWGWRACFSVGFVLAAIGFYLRIVLPETEVFMAAKQKLRNEHVKAISLLLQVNVFKLMLKLVVLVAAYAYFYQLLFIWLPITLLGDLPNGHSQALFINVIAMLIFIVAVLFGGRLSDFYGRKQVMLTAEIAILLTCLPGIYLLTGSTNLGLLLGIQGFFAVVFGIFVGSASTYFAEAFIPGIRASALSLSYNIPYAVFGGLTPAALTGLVGYVGFYAIAYLSIIIFVLALLVTCFINQPQKSNG